MRNRKLGFCCLMVALALVASTGFSQGERRSEEVEVRAGEANARAARAEVEQARRAERLARELRAVDVRVSVLEVQTSGPAEAEAGPLLPRLEQLYRDRGIGALAETLDEMGTTQVLFSAELAAVTNRPSELALNSRRVRDAGEKSAQYERDNWSIKLMPEAMDRGEVILTVELEAVLPDTRSGGQDGSNEGELSLQTTTVVREGHGTKINRVARVSGEGEQLIYYIVVDGKVAP